MWCDVDDTSVYYEIVGDGRPIVFLHGWSMDLRVEASDYEPIFGQRPGWQRIYLDLPGMGRTTAGPSIIDQDRILAVVLGFIDQVLPRQRFVLSGTSAGAYLARGVVRDRADALDGLLLRVPCIIADDARRTVPSFQPLIEDQQLIAGLDPIDKAGLGDVLVQQPSYIDAQRHKLQTRIRPAEQAAGRISHDIRADPARYGFSFDVDALAVPFQAPTLIMAGRQDTSVGYRDAWSILENYLRATFAVLDRADHGWPLDNIRLLHALVNDWLDRIEEAGATGAGT